MTDTADLLTASDAEIEAHLEAADDGYDEALLLDASGFVSEGAGENVFLVKDGAVHTFDSADSLREAHGKSVDQLFREVFAC